ncbi:acyl-CoA N-acyltransferase [Rhodocollybia butyracea]|uniref:Acyl-CoA N-acyltransferase n=1 Tax=Rhodocollybia butyracea TaxID=206335 RepID=A0A9P5P6U2_9AGAR|nr:acyl-CoA N-acyltransferase [Rhodocollybia butyracea]
MTRLPFTPPLSSSRFTLSRCTPTDVPQMVSTYLAAFSQTPFDYFWPPSLDSMRDWSTKRFLLRFADPKDQQFKLVDNETGDLVGFIRWYVPEGMKGLDEGFEVFKVFGDESDEIAKKHKSALPEGVNEELWNEFFGGMKKMNDKWDTKRMLVLGLLCTHPSYQNQGAAKALMENVLRIADNEGIRVYVESLSTATGVYKRFGFKEIDRLEFDLSKAGREGTAGIDIMIREPNVPNVPLTNE